MNRLQKHALLLSFFAILCGPRLDAATHIWTGAVNDLFSVAGNWSGGSPAGDANAQLSFPPGARLLATNDLVGLTVRSIAFSGSGYQIGGSAITTTEGTEIFDSTDGPTVISCNLVLQSDLTVYSLGADDGGITFAGVLSGTGGIRLLGGGRLVLGGTAANTYTGLTHVLHGEMQLRKPAGVTAIPAALLVEYTGGFYDFASLRTFADEQIADSAHVTVGRKGTLAIGGAERIGPLTLHWSSWLWSNDPGILSLGGDVSVVQTGWASGQASASGTFYLPASRTITFPDDGDSLSLRDIHGAPGAGLRLNSHSDPGPGTQAQVDLRGDWNGPTIVNGGVVLVENAQTVVELWNGRLFGTVASLDATGGELLGEGPLHGLVSKGDIRLRNATRVALEVAQGSPAPIRLNGTLDLGSAQLQVLTTGGTPTRQFGATYTVIENASSLPVVGAFAGYPEGAVIDDRWQISYRGGSGNDVTLTEAGHVPSAVTFDITPSPTTGISSTYTISVVATPALAVPTGSSTIWKGDLLLATIPIVNGSGSANMTLPRGLHELTVRYGGNALVAPSESMQTVAVAAPTPTITSVEPASLPADSMTTITIHGSNFAEGAFVLANDYAAQATVISANTLKYTLRTPGYEGPLDLQVVLHEPVSVYSAPFPVTVTAPLPKPPTKLTFTMTTASAPVAPGAQTAWAARAQGYVSGARKWYTVVGQEADDDNDGLATWTWPSYDPMPGNGIWVATDLNTGEIMAGSPSLPHVPASGLLPETMFLRDTNGHFSHVILPAGRAALLQWARPGVGAWYHYAQDASADDLDRTWNGQFVFNTSIMQPLSDSPAVPAGVEPGDRFIAIQQDAEQWSGDAVDEHLGDTPGTATLSFPQFVSGSAIESSGVLKIAVLREHNSDGTATIDYATSPPNPRPGEHYSDLAGRLTFGPGEIVKTIDIPMIDDALYSGQSEFELTLSNPVGAILGGTSRAQVIIRDDELPPEISLSIPASSAVEMNAGTHEVPVTIHLASAAATPITVNWSWREGPYGATTNGSQVFAPGETQKDFTFTWSSNTVPEADRYITYAAGWNSTSRQGSFAIVDDDFATVSVQDTAVGEGRRTAAVRFSLDEYSTRPVTVHYTITAVTAGGGSDFVAESGTIPIGPPDTFSLLNIWIVDDTVAESTEYFIVSISSADGAVIGNGTAIVSIIDDDDAAGSVATPQGLSATGNTASVNVSWLSVANAWRYEIHRASAGSASALVGTATGTSFLDSTVATGKAYVYRVIAVASDNSKSAFSAPDVATTIAFEDDPLVSGNRTKSVHLEQLRTAVNAVRGATGLSAVSFATPVTAGAPIRASHITLLRTALNEARQALGIAAVTFTDPTLNLGVTTVKAAHINEIRQGCR